MTLLVAVLLFGVSGVAGVTVITLSALSYAKYLDAVAGVLHDEDRCGALYVWNRSKPKWDKAKPWNARCLLENGHDGPHKNLRIALCGYEGEHVMPSTWECHAWKGARGYASADNDNRSLERIWFSPHCLPLVDVQTSLFGGVA